MREQLQARYLELDNEVKRQRKADKKAFIEKLADGTETAAKTQNIAALYKVTNTLAGVFRNNEVPVKDVNGNVTTGVAEQTQGWKSYFETILNKEAPSNLADIPVSDEDLEINPDKEEVRKAVRKAISSMKSGKAQGSDDADGVSADMLKAGQEIIVRTLIEIFEGIWEIEEISSDWKTGLIIKLPNKEDLSMWNNWKGVTLLSVTRNYYCFFQQSYS